MRIEFNVYDDDTLYFMYVTDQVRIEIAQQGLLIEDRQGEVHTISDPMKYLTIEQHEDEYFQASLVEPHLDTIIEAVKVLSNKLTNRE